MNWINHFEPHILERGWEYYRSGAVEHLVKTENTVEAIIRGSEYYKVKIVCDRDEIEETYCSCPYAAKGYPCKHMAAALYAAENRQDESLADSSSVVRPVEVTKRQSLEELIRVADREALENALLDLAYRDVDTADWLRIFLSGSSGSIDLEEAKHQIDEIFLINSDRGGFINYYHAQTFETDLTTYLERETERLINEGKFLEAFQLSMYAFVEVGNCDIDDDGQITAISNACYKIWLNIIKKCSPGDRDWIKEWFEEHAEDGTVIDYMEDTLQDFLRYELASEEELKEEIAHLDQLIEESGDGAECRRVYTSYYGYGIEAIAFRIILMRRLGADEDDVDAFRRSHIHFRSVRQYYMQRAREEKNLGEEMRLLEESRRLDAGSAALQQAYSKRLIEILHETGDYARKKWNEERLI